MLEIRIYDAKDSLIRWDTAPDAQILASFQGAYVNPRLGRMKTVSVDGHPARVLTVHSDGVEEYLVNVYFDDSLVSIMCTSDTRAKIVRHRAAFLAFLHSLRFEKTL